MIPPQRGGGPSKTVAGVIPLQSCCSETKADGSEGADHGAVLASGGEGYRLSNVAFIQITIAFISRFTSISLILKTCIPWAFIKLSRSVSYLYLSSCVQPSISITSFFSGQ